MVGESFVSEYPSEKLCLVKFLGDYSAALILIFEIQNLNSLSFSLLDQPKESIRFLLCHVDGYDRVLG